MLRIISSKKLQRIEQSAEKRGFRIGCQAGLNLASMWFYNARCASCPMSRADVKNQVDELLREVGL